MRLKAMIQNKVAKRWFSIERRDAKRREAEQARTSKNLPHVVEYFHEVGDPYSHLMVQILPEFVARYDVDFRVHLAPPPPDWAAPDRQRLDAYARKDAERLAKRLGLSFADPMRQPTPSQIDEANASLITVTDAQGFLQKAAEIGAHIWNPNASSSSVEPTALLADAMKTAAQHRDELGHYLSGTLYYAGEWYWGPDRLHYLERRLQDLGAGEASKPIFEPPLTPSGKAEFMPETRPVLHWYLSFRSPYTGIVRDRVKVLADAYGADLKLRYVLPMVMRGMQVPRKKGFYIMSDTAREADRLGVTFGNLFDPVGEPVERGYAILHEAIRRGVGYEFAHSFLSGVWSDGIDAGSDKGLKIITERAGLSWSEMQPLLAGDHWRETAEANQQEMFSYGIWGVPSFRVGDVATWGQDRLWVIEDELQRITKD